jgi:hypothetical protein
MALPNAPSQDGRERSTAMAPSPAGEDPRDPPPLLASRSDALFAPEVYFFCDEDKRRADF